MLFGCKIKNYLKSWVNLSTFTFQYILSSPASASLPWVSRVKALMLRVGILKSGLSVLHSLTVSEQILRIKNWFLTSNSNFSFKTGTDDLLSAAIKRLNKFFNQFNIHLEDQIIMTILTWKLFKFLIRFNYDLRCSFIAVFQNFFQHHLCFIPTKRFNEIHKPLNKAKRFWAFELCYYKKNFYKTIRDISYLGYLKIVIIFSISKLYIKPRSVSSYITIPNLTRTHKDSFICNNYFYQ